jgi:hypothetical protein
MDQGRDDLSNARSTAYAKGIARRLTYLLKFVKPVSDMNFEPISTIREFIGGSEFGEL